jgi:hypothetical protein
MTTRLSILVLAAAVTSALACAPRRSSRAAPPPAAPTAPASAGGVRGGGAAQKPGSVERSATAAATALEQAGAAEFSGIHAGLEDASSQECLGCHADTRPVIQPHTSHPIDLDYAATAERRSADLAPLSDVVARGIAVPGGKIACLTCHALSSPWKYHLAMPTGATPRPAVRLGDPSSYEDDSTSPPPPGSEVSAKPLCRACHTY